jgi:hypothetical protein
MANKSEKLEFAVQLASLSVRGGNLFERVVQETSAQCRSDSIYIVPFGKSNPTRDQLTELTVDLENRASSV